MDRIKERQQKFKRGKEKMLSLAQESGEGPQLIQAEEEDEEDDGTVGPRFRLNKCANSSYIHGTGIVKLK